MRALGRRDPEVVEAASTITRAPEIWSQVTGMPSHGRASPSGRRRSAGRARRSASELGVEARDLARRSRGCARGRSASESTTTRSRMSSMRPLPEHAASLRQMQRSRVARRRSRARPSRATSASGRICRKRELRRRRRAAQVHRELDLDRPAHALLADLEQRRRGSRPAGTGSCFRIGAKLTSRTPGREMPS